MNPLSLKRLLGLARRNFRPAKDRDVFSGLDEFSRLKNDCVVGTRQGFEKVCYFISVFPQTCIGQAVWSNELPIRLFGDQIQYRRKIVTAVRFVSLFNDIERCTRIHFVEGGRELLNARFLAKAGDKSRPMTPDLKGLRWRGDSEHRRDAYDTMGSASAFTPGGLETQLNPHPRFGKCPNLSGKARRLT
jgi:hypothetical protein